MYNTIARAGALALLIACNGANRDTETIEVGTETDTDTEPLPDCIVLDEVRIGVRVEDVKDVASLTNVCEITGDFTIVGYLDQGATDLDGLERLAVVGGDLSIEDGDALQNIDGLSGLQSVGRQLTIASNDLLLGLDGLSALRHVGGEISISANAALRDIDGLSGLSVVSGTGLLRIDGNASLQDLDGLSGLTSVNSLRIGTNASLQDLNGLDSLTSVSGYLSIVGNTSLCQSKADEFAAGVVISGWTAVTQNDPDC